MKKSGTRRCEAGTGASGSAEAVIAPQRHEVTVQVLAERDYLVRKAPPKRERERVVRRGRLAMDEAPLRESERASAGIARRDRLQRRLGGPRRATASHRHRVHEYVKTLRAHAD